MLLIDFKIVSNKNVRLFSALGDGPRIISVSVTNVSRNVLLSTCKPGWFLFPFSSISLQEDGGCVPVIDHAFVDIFYFFYSTLLRKLVKR